MQMKKAAYGFLAALISVFLYILLHECGHLIVMLSVGSTITEFSILSAHVSAMGGNYTALSDLWLHANGVFFPVVVSWGYMVLYKKNSGNEIYILSSYLASILPVFSLLVWIVMPFAYIQGNAPAGDDITKFLNNFSQEYHPLLVSAVAVLLIAISVTVMVKKGIVREYLSLIGKR